jgi:hypothetical protein
MNQDNFHSTYGNLVIGLPQWINDYFEIVSDLYKKYEEILAGEMNLEDFAVEVFLSLDDPPEN